MPTYEDVKPMLAPAKEAAELIVSFARDFIKRNPSMPTSEIDVLISRATAMLVIWERVTLGVESSVSTPMTEEWKRTTQERGIEIKEAINAKMESDVAKAFAGGADDILKLVRMLLGLSGESK